MYCSQLKLINCVHLDDRDYNLRNVRVNEE